jgi:hypothetical protein
MKAIWTVVSVLAVANLLALTGFVGWLAKSDRLNMERMRDVRGMLSKPIAQEKAEQDEKANADEAEKVKAEAEAKAAKPPLTAREKLDARIEATELDRQRLERLKREVADLQRRLADDRRVLDNERAAFVAEKKAFEDQLASTEMASTDEQFKKTLKVLQTQKPTVAVALLKEMMVEAQPEPVPAADAPLVANGTVPSAPEQVAPTTSEKGMGLVVSYLDAMNDKTRSKIIETLTKTDPKLAAELLERLRKRGEFARVQ